jgi:hypothetical protein
VRNYPLLQALITQLCGGFQRAQAFPRAKIEIFPKFLGWGLYKRKTNTSISIIVLRERFRQDIGRRERGGDMGGKKQCGRKQRRRKTERGKTM